MICQKLLEMFGFISSSFHFYIDICLWFNPVFLYILTDCCTCIFGGFRLQCVCGSPHTHIYDFSYICRRISPCAWWMRVRQNDISVPNHANAYAFLNLSVSLIFSQKSGKCIPCYLLLHHKICNAVQVLRYFFVWSHNDKIIVKSTIRSCIGYLSHIWSWCSFY